MSKVFVLDTNFTPLNPIHSAQARQLLRNKKAALPPTLYIITQIQYYATNN